MPLAACLLLLIGQSSGLRASIESGNLFAQQLHFSSYAEMSRTARELNCVDWTWFRPQNWLPRQRPLRDRKTNFGSFIVPVSVLRMRDFAPLGTK